jgi:hypothetical protein
MSKSDEKSKQYRDFREQCGIKDPVMLNEIEEACYEGYHQAEKDLELGWEDFVLIRLAFDATEANINLGGLKISPMTKEYYQEVLKRFKDLKEREEK